MEIVQNFLTILIPLIIIMDPIGNLPFFLLFTKSNSTEKQNRTAAITAGGACCILIFFALTGDFILAFFGIGLPAFQLAGGLIFLIYALQMLRLIPSGIKTSSEEKEEGIEKDNVALVPLATPMLAGPGAITAVLVKTPPFFSITTVLLFLSIIFASLIIYCVFRWGTIIQNVLGVSGIRLFTRLTGLLLAVIAVQFIVNGLLQIR